MRYLFIALSVILITSCNQDYGLEDHQISEYKMNSAVVNAIKTTSPDGQLSYYQLPTSDDYGRIPQDPNNALTRDKVELGKLLFHETAFSTDGKFSITKEEYSCASCHHAGAGFQAGMAQGLGEGGEGFGLVGEARVRNPFCAPELCDVQPIRSPTILNGAYQPVMLWNGQFGATDVNVGTEDQWTEGTPKEINRLGFEGLEVQAIAGLEVHRIIYDEESVIENGYKNLWDRAFSDVNIENRYTRITAGLALAAYERTVLSNEAPFQQYLNGDYEALSEDEKNGALIFFGKGQCSTCHTGPALNKMEFHALGLNEFNPDEVTFYNPEDPTRFGRFSFTKNEEDRFKFKTPQLYNLKGIEFLGHGSSMHSVREIIEYKNRGIAENPEVPADVLALKPLGLSDLEVDQLIMFVERSLYDSNLDRYVPSSLPSENCFPNNDIISKVDLGCD